MVFLKIKSSIIFRTSIFIWVVLVILFMMYINGIFSLNKYTVDNLSKPPSRNHALLISINLYQRPDLAAPLQGPGNDMDALARVLVDRFGFGTEHISRLHNQAACRQGILAGLASLLAQAKEGAQLVIAFAGHGSYTEDANSEEEANGADETLCPYDRGVNGVSDILDDELYRYCQAMLAKGAYVTLILDSCHSGNAAKDEGVIKLRTATPLAKPTLLEKTLDPESARTDFDQRFTFLAAAAEDQAAGEMSFSNPNGDTQVHGIFTHALLETLAIASPEWTWQEVFGRVAEATRALNPMQTPLLKYGQQTRLFGSRTVTQQPLFRVQTIAEEGQSLTLPWGTIAGFQRGSFLKVFAKGLAGDFQNHQPLAIYRVDDVTEHQASAMLVAAESDDLKRVGPGCPILHVEASQAARPWGVLIEATVPAPVRDELAIALASYSHAFQWAEQLKDPSRGFRFWVDGAGSQQHLYLTGTAVPFEASVATDAPKSLAERAVQQMLRKVLWQRVLDLRNPLQAEMEGFPLEVTLQRGSAELAEYGIFKALPPLPPDPATQKQVFQTGDLLQLSYRNPTKTPFFVTVLFLSRQGEVLAWNRDQFDGVLLNNQTVNLPDWIRVAPPLGEEWIKIFVTRSKPFDPSPFLQGSKGDPPPEHFFDEITWATREIGLLTIPKL